MRINCNLKITCCGKKSSSCAQVTLFVLSILAITCGVLALLKIDKFSQIGDTNGWITIGFGALGLFGSSIIACVKIRSKQKLPPDPVLYPPPPYKDQYENKPTEAAAPAYQTPTDTVTTLKKTDNQQLLTDVTTIENTDDQQLIDDLTPQMVAALGGLAKVKALPILCDGEEFPSSSPIMRFYYIKKQQQVNGLVFQYNASKDTIIIESIIRVDNGWKSTIRGTSHLLGSKQRIEDNSNDANLMLQKIRALVHNPNLQLPAP